jgi:two-component system, chemotaxis family, CheB/CheR fusion protein
VTVNDMSTERTTALAGDRSRFAGVVVAIGASAGALSALRTLLGGLDASTGATFVVVVHRAPGHDRRLVELLEPYLSLPIREAKDDTLLEPDTIIVVPPTAEVSVIDSHLRLVSPADRMQRGYIDGVFRAVAAARGPRGVGVVLTGAGSDGALGLAQIRDKGGLTIAQDPAEAEFGSMPRSAVQAGVVDLALPLREMAAAIARYCGTDPQLPFGSHDGAHGEDERVELAELAEIVKERTGHDLSVYRPALVLKRIARRMRILAIDAWPTYLERLRADAGEGEVLAHEVLLNAGEFFCQRESFERLENEALSGLFALKGGESDTLRAWVVGCSTGEDAYSLAITLLEQRAKLDLRPRIQVFASDLSEDALQRARLGLYPTEIETMMSSERLAKFFVREDDRAYRVTQALRNVVVFAWHDVVKDFPFSQLDLAVCRPGLLDGFKPEVRQAVLRNFHYALKPHGLLVADSNSGVDEEAPQLFGANGDGLYRRLPARSSVVLPPASVSPSPVPRQRKPALAHPRLVHLGLLERYSPASVLVDADDNVIHYSARASRFLRLPGGEVTHQLLQLLREPLRSAVRGGLEAVDRRPAKWVSDSLLVHADNGVMRVAVHVEPAESTDTRLVVFEELAPGDTLTNDNRGRTASDFTSGLESGLEEASQRLRAIVAEGKEPSVGTPQDWELVHVLDDIDSAKEELQSINKELMSLSQDNRARVEDLARLSADLEVLLESTGLATLFLDGDLKIVRFTAPLLEIFHVLPSDKGRPLGELSHRLRDSELLDDARRVLQHLAPIEREAEADNGKWYLIRMLPYRSAPHGMGGVAITLVDITTRKKAELELRTADRRKDEFIALLAHELRNPLAPISSGIEILKRRDLDAAVAERVTLTMSRQAAQLVRLIDDLLDVSRISSGRLQLRKSRVRLSDIVRDAVAAVRPMIERAGHQLSVDAPREPIVLEADAARLTQVVANLLNNATRYTPAGGKISIGVQRDGDAVVLSVKDTGYGIPENALPHVFEMFYQGADPRSATQTGLGIGLALAKSLVEMHGGTISASSGGLDRGAEFKLRLPALERSAADDAHVAVPAHAPLKNHRVLVVDDNADAAQTLAMLLQALGANDVHVALSGEEALPLAERVRPDTVFLDLKMADMDGYEVAQRLRQEPWGEEAWLVALTGWGLEEHKRRTKDAGFDQHLTKPADRAALEAILSRPAGRA